jgi:Response regulator receiver domain
MSAARIMIVDDEPPSCRWLRAALIERGFEVSDARTGEEALERLYAVAPHVVLLGLTMPGMSGLEICLDRETRFHCKTCVKECWFKSCRSVGSTSTTSRTFQLSRSRDRLPISFERS